MMPKALEVPDCVQFNRAVWNSEPFIEHFLYNLKARKYYLLDDSDCRNSLINLFSILDFWTMQTESQTSVRTILSSLCIILAVNIRESESAPLVQTFDDEEFATDPLMTQRFEQPISRRNQVSEEIQNAVRSVKSFETVAPALAWAIVRFFIGGIAVAETVDSELHRWTQHGKLVQHPRGCVAFLERKLAFVKNFSFLPPDLATLVKTTAVYLKNNASESANMGIVSTKRQLAKFTECFIGKNLGPWLALERITAGNLEHQSALIESFRDHCGSAPLAKCVATLSRFHENIAKHFEGFKLDSHYVFSVYKSCMLSYLHDSQIQNCELAAEIHKVEDILSKVRDVRDLDCDVSEALSPADLSARQWARRFLMSLTQEERLYYLVPVDKLQSHAEEMNHTTQSSSKPGKRSKRRKKKT